MKIRLVAYGEIDGIRVFSDSEIAAFYDRMEKDGTAGAVFYDKKVNNRDEFVSFMKRPNNYLYVIVDDSEKGKAPEQIGLVWLNNLRHRLADLHFCFFSNAWGDRTVDAGKETVRKLINLQTNKGEYVFDAFFGIVPWFNFEAVRLVKLCGGIAKCDLSCVIWNGRTGKNEGGTLFQYVRESAL